MVFVRFPYFSNMSCDSSEIPLQVDHFSDIRTFVEEFLRERDFTVRHFDGLNWNSNKITKI